MGRGGVTSSLGRDVGEDAAYSFGHSLPLLSISLALFMLMTLLTRDAVQPWYATALFDVQPMSGDRWSVTGADLFLGGSVLLLFAELVKATRTTGSAIVNHALSALVFITALLLFVTQRGYGNSSFFLFTLLTAVDFLAGFIITTIAARRDIVVSRGGASGG